MTAYGLTPRQQDTLKFIVEYQSSHGGTSPSFDEIAAALAIAKSRIHCLVHGLRNRGYVDFIPGAMRSIAVVQHPTFTLPPDTLAKLYALCRATGDKPADVVADAVALHLDELALEAAA